MQTSWPPSAAGRPLRALIGRVPLVKLLSARASGLRVSWRGGDGALDLPPGCWSCGPWRQSHLEVRRPAQTHLGPCPSLPACIPPRPPLAHPELGHGVPTMVIALLIAASLPKPCSVITEGADLTAQPPRSQALRASSGTEGINYIFPSPSFKVGECRQVPGEGAVSKGCGRGTAAGFPWPPPPKTYKPLPSGRKVGVWGGEAGPSLI